MNFVAIVGMAAVFLESQMVGKVNMTASAQASMVQTVLAPYGGVKAFAGDQQQYAVVC